MTITEFTKQCRAKQGAFREEMGEPMGVGPWRTSEHKHTNMIVNGEVTGKNFVNEDVFNYAKKRVANKKKNETSIVVPCDFSWIFLSITSSKFNYR